MKGYFCYLGQIPVNNSCSMLFLVIKLSCCKHFRSVLSVRVILFIYRCEMFKISPIIDEYDLNR